MWLATIACSGHSYRYCPGWREGGEWEGSGTGGRAGKEYTKKVSKENE